MPLATPDQFLEAVRALAVAQPAIPRVTVLEQLWPGNLPQLPFPDPLANCQKQDREK